MTLNVACADCSTRKFGKSRIGVWWGGGPVTIGSNRLRAILGSLTRRRFAPAPKTLLGSRFVERGTWSRLDNTR